MAKKKRVNWENKDLEKIEKAVSDWDNGTSDCVDENEIPFENNRLNMKFLAEIWIPLLNIGEIFFSNLTKRRVIGDGVGWKSLLHKKDYDFAGQVAAIYDCVDNGLARCEMIDFVQELNPNLDRPAASRQVSRHIIPKEKQADYIKGFVTPQSTTTDRSAITAEQQFWWHTLMEDQYKR